MSKKLKIIPLGGFGEVGKNMIAYEIDGRRVILSRAGSADEDPFATFEEWGGDADNRAYAKL